MLARLPSVGAHLPRHDVGASRGRDGPAAHRRAGEPEHEERRVSVFDRTDHLKDAGHEQVVFCQDRASGHIYRSKHNLRGY